VKSATGEFVRRNETLLLLSGQVFIIMLGLGLVTPILPLYAQSFGVGAAAVGSLVTVFGLARMAVNIPVGHFTERFGRRMLLIGGPLLTSAGSLGFAFAGAFAELLVWRVVQGVGSAMLTTAAMVVLTDISTKETRGRIMSLYQGSLLLGAGAGPALGGFLAELYGIRIPFIIFAVLTLGAALWALLRIPETRPHAPDAARRSNGSPTAGGEAAEGTRGRPMRRLLRTPDFLLVSAVTLGIFFTRAGGQMTLLPLLGHNVLGMSESRIGLAFTLIAGINFLALYGAGVLSDRFGRKAVIVPSGLITAVAVVLFLYTGSVTLFFLNAALFGVGIGLGGPAPAAYAADIAPPGAVGPMMGLYRTISDLGLVIGPVLLGWMVDVSGYALAFWTNGILLVVTTLAFALLARESVAVRPRAPASG
jgi:DHA1 family multidrug resistance protein-like MFS transporter